MLVTTVASKQKSTASYTGKRDNDVPQVRMCVRVYVRDCGGHVQYRTV